MSLYRVLGKARRMPLIATFFLIGCFVWLGENIATFLGAWQYPNQRGGWSMVHPRKISSWFLLVIVSFMIVAQLKHVKEGTRRPAAHKPEPFAQLAEGADRMSGM